MAPSRRQVLGALATGVTAASAGCVGGPSEMAGLDLSIREPFDPEPPVTVPVSIDVELQNVDTREVALRDVAIACYDRDRAEIGSRHVGTLSWHTAPPSSRRSEELTSWGGISQTVFEAEWTVETAVELEAVPTWITPRVASVYFGDKDEERDDSTGFVGTARASQPAPEFTVDLLEYVGPEPFESPVPPGAYDQVGLSRDSGTYVDATDRFLPEARNRDHVEVESVELRVAHNPLPPGDRTPVQVLAHYEDGLTEQVTDEVRIRAADSSVADVDYTRVIGVSAGETRLEATYRGETATVTFVVGSTESDR